MEKIDRFGKSSVVGYGRVERIICDLVFSISGFKEEFIVIKFVFFRYI